MLVLDISCLEYIHIDFFFSFFFGYTGSLVLYSGLLSLWKAGLLSSSGAWDSLRWVLLWDTGSREHGLQWFWSMCSTGVGGDSRAQAQSLQHMGSAAPWLVESPWTRDQIPVPCITRWALNH